MFLLWIEWLQGPFPSGERRTRPWYLLALHGCSSALTLLPKNALLLSGFSLTLAFFFSLHAHGQHYPKGYEVSLHLCPARHPLPTLLRHLCRGGASLCLILNRSFIVLPAALDKGVLSCTPAPASRPTARSQFIPTRDAAAFSRIKAGCFLSVNNKVLRNPSGFSSVLVEDGEPTVSDKTSGGVVLTHTKCFWVSCKLPAPPYVFQHVGRSSEKLLGDCHRANENLHI